MPSTIRARILATGLAGTLFLAPAAGAIPSSEELRTSGGLRDAADSLATSTAQGSEGSPAAADQPTSATAAESTRPVVVRTVEDGVDLGSVALGAGGAAVVLLVSAAGITAMRHGGLRQGLS
jgi:hypothetical protein